MTEFEVIQRYFQRHAANHWLRLGIGDDAALIAPEPGFELVLCSDTSVAGRHFPENTAPVDIGWKALAVNLSDLAAMGATPRGFLLNLTLPQADSDFLQAFAAGLFELAEQTGVLLMGGDTTRGSLSISITAIGQVPEGQALKRSGAQADDRIVLVGDLGGAALALQYGEAADSQLRQRLDRPMPFVEQGLILREYAHSAIDVSDGLLADMTHILAASHCGAQLDLAHLPLHPQLQTLDPQSAQALALNGGDDYALLASMSDQAWLNLQQALPAHERATYNCIGRITRESGIIGCEPDGSRRSLEPRGYQHF